MKKEELIRFRCTNEQRKAIESAAKAKNMSLTDYILFKLNCSHKNNIVATSEPKIVATNKKEVITKEKKELPNKYKGLRLPSNW